MAPITSHPCGLLNSWIWWQAGAARAMSPCHVIHDTTFKKRKRRDRSDAQPMRDK